MKPAAVVSAMIGSSLLLLFSVLVRQGSLWSSSTEQFWGEKMKGKGSGRSGWGFITNSYYTIGAILLILIYQLAASATPSWFRLFSFKPRAAAAYPRPRPPSGKSVSSSSFPLLRISGIVSDLDLKSVMENLDEHFREDVKWENVIDRSNNFLSYNARCCRPKDGPLKYLSVTIFEDCSVELLRDFYMDNDYRKTWDQTLVAHEQLQVDEISGTEIGRTVKKFPFLTLREYILAWRLWEGKNKTFYCFSKECEHPLAPRQKKYVRVGFYRSGWRIRKVHGRNACEIKVVYQEDAGLNVAMAKLAFAKGVWSYVCKMNDGLRRYSAIRRPQLTSEMSAITLIQKVPAELDIIDSIHDDAHPESSVGSEICSQDAEGCNGRKLSKRPSNKLIAKGLILLGGAICLSRTHSNLGSKVAMAYILSKLAKRGASSGRCG